jgi:putative glutamine amidotransferase
VDHNRAGTRTDRSHAIRVAPGSLAAEALGATSLRVNSFHHQGIRELAPGLVATGWGEDDLVEAVEGAEGQPWMLAVQWHPEEMHADAGAPDRGLFKALVERAEAFAVASVDS